MTDASTPLMATGRLQRLGTAEAASDHQLLERVAGGDDCAMRALFARHHVRVFRFILRLLNDPGLAEDVTSEVFLDLWRHAGTFKSRSAVTTWLLAIARNKALSALRHPHLRKLDEAAARQVADPADDPEMLIRRQDAGAVVRRCLQALSREHREVIDLVYYHERTIGEIAEIVGIPAGTVKTRVFHARRRLGELLRAAGIDRSTA